MTVSSGIWIAPLARHQLLRTPQTMRQCAVRNAMLPRSRVRADKHRRWIQAPRLA